jgi:DNA-binding NarL/FixJ family response regulator
MTGAPPRRIRVLLVDDDALVRAGLTMMLDGTHGIEVVGEASDGGEVPAAVDAHGPDVVLMDLRMPNLDGVEATRQILATHPGTEIVVLTTHADEASILDALGAGARGYLTKDAGIAEIARAVHAAAAHQTLLDPVVQQQLLAAATARPPLASQGKEAGESGPPTPPATLPDDLTPREAEVLTLIAGGLSNREIAAALFVSEATVKTHINHVFSKIGVRDRAQAVHYAYTHGLVA